MRIERRAEVPYALAVAAPFLAILGALVVAGILILLAGANPLEAYRLILVSSFGSRLSITETLVRATPLIFTGLAAAIAFRARIWNIGGEGQLYLGAIVTAALGHAAVATWPMPLAAGTLMLMGALAGALLLVGPVLLRLWSGADEVVTTLLLNFIVLLLIAMLIEGPLRDESALGWPQSVAIDSEIALPQLAARSRLHVGLVVAVVVAFGVWFLQARTTFGFEARAVGLSPRAATFAGVSLPRTLVLVAALSGGMAGLAGSVEVLGVREYVTTDLSANYGYSGIVVAMLGGLNPLGVIAAAIFVALTFVGVDGMSRALHVPSFIADVIVSVALIMMLLALFVTTHRVRR